MATNYFYKTMLESCFILIFLLINIPSSNSQTFCTKAGTERYAGTKDGYRYELWNQNGQGTACMTLGNGALFSGEWSGILNYLARIGLGYNQTMEHQEIGRFYSTYNCNYKPSSASGNSYLSIYGWTTSPLIEFYIVEDWRNWIPSMASGVKRKGTIEVNGSIYDIYENTRVNQPSIIGTATFQQYFSIRRNRRNSGTINISEHFDKWESLGMEMGKMYEVSFVVEGYQSSGNFEFTELDVYVSNDQVSTPNITKTSSQIVVYPNPNNGDRLYIKTEKDFVNINVKIFDELGNTVLSQENLIHDYFDISGLKRGVYFLKVYNDKLDHTEKLWIQ